MTEETMEKTLNSFFEGTSLKKVRLLLFGGEPLVNKKLFYKTVLYAEKLAKSFDKQLSISTTTNGTLITDEVCFFMKKHNIVTMVSVDGPDYIHDKQVRFKSNGKKTHQTVIRNIEKLLNYGIKVSARATLTPEFSTSLIETITFLDKFPFSRIIIGMSNCACTDSPQNDYFDAENYAHFASQMDHYLKIILTTINKGEKVKFLPHESTMRKIKGGFISKHQRGFNRCHSLAGNVGIMPDGSIIPCTRYTGMKGWEVKNFDNKLLKEKATFFWRQYNENIPTKCQCCWAHSVCGGLCPWEISTEQGIMKKIEPSKCVLMKKIIEQSAFLCNYIGLGENIVNDPNIILV